MLIIPNGKKHLIWCRIAKTASKSTLATLEGKCAYQYVDKVLRHHVPYHAGKQVLTVLDLADLEKLKINIDDCYIFAVVRNPYERALSGWNYHQAFVKDDSFLFRLKNPPQYPKNIKRRPQAYSSWLHFTKTMTESISYNEQMRADHIIRFENYEVEFVDFCKKIGLDVSSAHRYNVGRVHEVKELSREEIDEIDKLFEEDFINFNYNKR